MKYLHRDFGQDILSSTSHTNQPKQPLSQLEMVIGCHSTTGPPTYIASSDEKEEPEITILSSLYSYNSCFYLFGYYEKKKLSVAWYHLPG